MAAPTDSTDNLSSVKHVILILSGKGGVGKSTLATQLTLGLLKAGKKVGILDVDLCGPSIPKMLNLENRDVHMYPTGWLPVYIDDEKRLGVMSIAFLLDNKDEAVVWRGPRKTAMIRQFITDVCWQDVEYLIIDTPPGTSDEHIAVVESLKSYNPDGAILVTTPQDISVGDVRREATFCQKTGIPILGIIENMSGFVCPNCKECSNVFSKGGGEALARELGIPFLGCVPLDQHLSMSLEEGKNFITEHSDSPAVMALTSVVDRLIQIDKNL
ncbi:Cytosolic Fe-S cluster assembly factor cfd1,Cytosolic Fe-S cluster assembly factor NUBP2 homolog 1,Cytosolic Fe-S cluster assembly factor NBP35,Probable cytosolic Fe-S cluster assembly factor SJAG_02895,Cytosolic Fe-S cluster assembly factor nubp2,Cytosolic Fe-S cluster assembly factor NUBP1 homolog,Cytosolic Fe-S cluster assembly factor NUBP1,Cytosolic Fe-S cluster assembly factor NUBP2 homolog,Cytosolic Fe-S cluster assembly factor nubp1,Probable cytosolic Fe-S cluster assembly factor SPAC806.02c,Iron-su|uniref:Cytosolic Fe-S cluster assembly factor NUBP2 homolog n=1 Tax=Acanthosepion pharaonis TaxID=158019 RepID=A0A812CKX1_ACAPH|nr:Cytosolic Fe-S cluster assembly factor cfd1,Cytosolic Fe-S cluster assembly factor NUBP2 homolog 1,Cytosolic Fe-S cluster assembly factor NBP35,Probable cytosolic Fe-S cluster assembly factor SJAG_02895,Cytosolic Fe-S cluster assembly factor nubp2,Cytosolic Fe-S cluster assembly factor NUBP1 homolog,Cytosolic Fe-S cluster assembly factor NUBP1,Cytosolic Fe-S cluster assembly factor NUBP2 homolog,Cytosolic Fe-S cluster assembly factor nubp1,Probable cytosolic Fe-S cluster assembly factor SPAC806.